ncbi:uncharacterized protein LOC135375906 isoform X2 [Ornithodoros turicata]|uniref:uncharacterized protein LOC135375906 isoform X2 n=1 Tax=Ornithodoros turicata TaxID=34597 RepID=UPI003139C89A
MASVTRNESELELRTLLQGADLLSYYDKFIEIGGDNVKQLRDDFQEVIRLVDMARKPLHVKRLKKALTQWTPQPVAGTSTAADVTEGELHELLRQADLISYHDKFMEIGGDSVQQLRDLTEEELQDVISLVGMARKPFHVKRFKKALEHWAHHAGTHDTDTSTLPTQGGPSTVAEDSPETESIRYEMHLAIDNKDVEQARRCLQEERRLKVWLHPSEKESAMYRAVTKNAFKIYGLLLSQKCDFKTYTPSDFENERDCLSRMNPLEKYELARQNDFVTTYETNYICALKSRSTSQAECAGFEEILDNLYNVLDTSDLLKPVLKLASMAPYLSIRFDFDQEHIQCMVGGGRTTLGITYLEKQRVFVGSKGLDGERTDTTERRTNEVAGTLVHELCHVALFLVYGNDGKPYHSTDELTRDHYAGILEDVRYRKDELDEILKLAFQGKDEAELIVRIPHILALYPAEGKTILQQQVPGLYQFFKEKVVQDMKQCIQNGCPIKDIEIIKEENGKLGRASSTEELGIEFLNMPDEPILRRESAIILVASHLTFLEAMINDLVRSAGVSYLFLETSQWKERTESILIENKCSFLLLSYEGKGDLKNVLNFSKVLHDVTGMKLILLTSKDNLQHCLERIKESTLCGIKIYQDTEHRASFENVTTKCKNNIIKKSRIALQSSDETSFIKDILNTDSFSKICQEETFLTLCRKGVLYIGPELKELQEDVSECYINQKCDRSIEVDLKKLGERSKDDAFAFIGCSMETLQSSLPEGLAVKKMGIFDCFEKIVLLEKERDYGRLVATEHYKGKTVHLLEFCEGRYMWKKSNGALSHLPMIGKEIYSSNDLLEVSQKIVVVSGDPGTGKTVLATRLCTQIKKEDKKAWVLYVSDYPKRQEAMELLDQETGCINIKQFAKLCRVKTSGEEFELLRQSVTMGSPFNVYVIFDAFEEIQDSSRKEVLQFVNVFVERNLSKCPEELPFLQSKVLIFTRTIFRDSVEGQMHVVAFQMVSFSDEDQARFQEKYKQYFDYMQSSPPNTKPDEKPFEAILRDVKNRDSTLLGNPLFLRMTTEMKLRTACDSDYTDLVQRMDSPCNCSSLLSVYRPFVQYAYLRYRKEKKNEDIGRAANEDDDEKLQRIFFRDHGLLALKAVLSEDDLQKLLSKSELGDLEAGGQLMMEVERNRLKHGLVQGLSNGVPRFVHHSFAEFLGANLLFQKVKEGKDSDTKRIVSRLYAESSYLGMLTFFRWFSYRATRSTQQYYE